MIKEIIVRKGINDRPSIELTVCRVESFVYARLGFDKFHYLEESYNPGAQFFLFEWEGTPVACYGVGRHLSCPGHIAQGHRLVVNPDFQGLGLSHRIAEFIAGVYKGSGQGIVNRTSHVKVGMHRNKDTKNWLPTKKNEKQSASEEDIKMYEESASKMRRRCRHAGKDMVNHKTHCTRVGYSHWYIGRPYFGYESMLLDVATARYETKLRVLRRLNK